MTPLKLDHPHDDVRKLSPIKLIDLRDFGLAASAPAVDGHPLLVFRQNPNGTLVPSA